MSKKMIRGIEAIYDIYDKLVKRYEKGDKTVTKSEDGHYHLLNDKGEEIFEIWRGR